MIRLAMLGCGKVAAAHAKRLRRHKHDVVVGFASRDRARAEAFAREHGGPSFGTYDEAIDSSAVDAVAIVTPPASHKDLAMKALAAGKHVVLEKPPLPRAADFAEIAAAAKGAGKRVFVAENYFYKPSLRKLQALLADGVVGDVLFVQVNAIKRQLTSGWRDDATQALGGALYEGGIHWIDFMANLGMEVRAARGLAPGMPGGFDPLRERSMLVTFDYAGGAVGTLAYSWEVPSTAKGLRLSKIYGKKGTITFESNGLWILVHGTRTRFHVPGLRDLAGYRAMWTDFVRAWREGGDAAFTLDHARRDLELVEAAYATAALSAAKETP
ncbi:MAG: Gfo/Idh/MocA family oxidoreductase [Deltaproteobacteria bacterium]|nr:Gfo/Idh/MocA family oxidoreductase [Deltaproteobacteria bacterium]